VKTVKAILRGISYVEGYGEHPGTIILVWLVLLGAIAGGWMGALIMLLVFGPLYLWGAYDRGRERQ